LVCRPEGAATSQPRATPWDPIGTRSPSPVRAKRRGALVSPFQGSRGVRARAPRALPWAELFGPFRANSPARSPCHSLQRSGIRVVDFAHLGLKSSSILTRRLTSRSGQDSRRVLASAGSFSGHSSSSGVNVAGYSCITKGQGVSNLGQVVAPGSHRSPLSMDPAWRGKRARIAGWPHLTKGLGQESQVNGIGQQVRPRRALCRAQGPGRYHRSLRIFFGR
jgi:hypothetical protein